MEEEEPDYADEFPTRQDSSSHRGVGGRSEERKSNPSRSRHSETEQRRRSKINERFQILRDLIPQNDTKRDKASFLLEVIEYIQFLQEKLHVYEGSYQGYNNQEPSKLTPWRKNNVVVESQMELAQVMKNGIDHDINVIVNSQMVAETRNSLDAVTPQMQQPSIFGSSSNVASHSDSEMWEAMPFITANYAVPNGSENQHEQLSIGSESSSLSIVYSQGILHTFTQALRSSGVDLSQAKISVQIDVANKRASNGSVNSKDHESEAQVGVGCYREESDIPSHKRQRIENSC